MKDYVLGSKAMLSSPFPQKEDTLSITPGAPKNIILFPRVVGSRSASPRQRSSTVDWLYGRFVTPYFPPRAKRRHQTIFLKHTLPFLLESTCPQVALMLGGVFHRRNEVEFGIDTYGWFCQQCHKAIADHKYRELPSIARHPRIKTERQRRAIRIICSLAAHDGQGDGQKGQFFLAERDLQKRLLLPTPATAGRILKRFCAIGVLEKLKSGQTRWDAKKMELKAEANSFRLYFQL